MAAYLAFSPKVQGCVPTPTSADHGHLVTVGVLAWGIVDDHTPHARPARSADGDVGRTAVVLV